MQEESTRTICLFSPLRIPPGCVCHRAQHVVRSLCEQLLAAARLWAALLEAGPRGGFVGRGLVGGGGREVVASCVLRRWPGRGLISWGL